MARSLEGQRVIVVGASAGIGREFAIRAIREGAKVILCARRADRLEEVSAEAGGGLPVPLDITNPESCANLAEVAQRELGGIDLVLVSAGYSPLRFLDETTPDVWRKVLEINVIGIHQVIRTLLPVVVPGGLFAVMSSESTMQPRHALGVYTSSKAALELSMRVWRQERPDRRFTTIVVGGTFPTDFGAEFEIERLLPAMDEWARHGTIQEKLMATEEVAEVVLGSLAAFVGYPDISIDQLVVRSPSAVVGGAAHLHEEAADNIARLNEAE